MTKTEVFKLTDAETLIAKYHEIMGEDIHTDGSHTLFNRGVFAGMEILAAAIAASSENVPDESPTE